MRLRTANSRRRHEAQKGQLQAFEQRLDEIAARRVTHCDVEVLPMHASPYSQGARLLLILHQMSA